MDANNPNSGEWVSVSVCAKQLGLHERQVRRYAERLKDTDRTPAGHLPLRVRVSAIQAMRDRTMSCQTEVVSEEEGKDTGQDTRQDTQDTVRPEGSLNAQQIAVIYEGRLQDSERVIQAKDMVIAEKDMRLAVLSELSEERKQTIERLTAEVEQLKQQLAIVAAPVEDTENSAQSAPNLDSTANQPPTENTEAVRGAQSQQRPWWQKIFKRGA